jgi:hypothetical protein
MMYTFALALAGFPITGFPPVPLPDTLAFVAAHC